MKGPKAVTEQTAGYERLTHTGPKFSLAFRLQKIAAIATASERAMTP